MYQYEKSESFCNIDSSNNHWKHCPKRYHWAEVIKDGYLCTSTSILMHSTLFLQKKIALEIHTFFSAWMKEARRKMLVAWWEQFWPTFDHLSGNSILTGIKYSLRIFSVRKKMLVKPFQNYIFHWNGFKQKSYVY